MSAKRAIHIHQDDNTVVAVEDLAAGDRVQYQGPQGETGTLKAAEAVPFGFKMALADIAQGERLLKFGEVMGYATKNIKRGGLVHVHNAQGLRVKGQEGEGPA